MIGGLIDDAFRAAEDLRDSAFGAFSEPSLRLGVTGLSRSGKSVFVTALVANLLARGRMSRLSAQAENRIEAAMLRPQPDRGVPRFDYEAHIAGLSAAPPVWPDSTRAVSNLRLSIRYRSGGWLSGLSGPRVLHLDIIDYPGEWLLDLPLLDWSYADWSARVLAEAGRPTRRPAAEAFLDRLAATDPTLPHDETVAQDLARLWTEAMRGWRREGLSGATPGRFLMPGDLAGSPAITFAPLPEGAAPRNSLAREFSKRYDAYRDRVVKPFFREHFARIERQIVLVDLLSALDAGPGAVADLRHSMTDVLRAFRPGRNSWLSAILGKRVDRILFAATKADHIHHAQHARLTAMMEALLASSLERARFNGAATKAIALASLRSTVEQDMQRDGQTWPVVRGRLMETGREAALYPGSLPDDPKRFVAEAREDAERGAGWLGGALDVMAFAPPPLSGRADEGPPHIRLDQAAEFLFGDKLA